QERGGFLPRTQDRAEADPSGPIDARDVTHGPLAAHHVDGSLAASFRRNPVSLSAATRARWLHVGVSRGGIGGLLVGRDSRRIIIAAVAANSDRCGAAGSSDRRNQFPVS